VRGCVRGCVCFVRVCRGVGNVYIQVELGRRTIEILRRFDAKREPLSAPSRRKEEVHQCVAVCCSVLQCVAVCCSTSILRRFKAKRKPLSLAQRGRGMSVCKRLGCKLCLSILCCSVLQRVAVCCSVLQCVSVCVRGGGVRRVDSSCGAACCSVLQCVAVCFSLNSGCMLCFVYVVS